MEVALVRCINLNLSLFAVGVVQPVTHAQPTELVSALGTRHVHTPLVLFNVFIAVWAGFRVFLDPELTVLLSCTQSLVPLYEHFTSDWLVWFLKTQKAILSLALIAGKVT